MAAVGGTRAPSGAAAAAQSCSKTDATSLTTSGSAMRRPSSWMCLSERQSQFCEPTNAVAPSTTMNLACTMPAPATADHSMMRSSRLGMVLSTAMPSSEFFSNFFSSSTRIFTPRSPAWRSAVSVASSGWPVAWAT